VFEKLRVRRCSSFFFWQNFFFPNENKISKTLIKLHEHESDQIYRSIIRSAFNTHTSHNERLMWREGKNKWLQCVFRPKTRRDLCVSMLPAFAFYNIKFDISTIWDHYFLLFNVHKSKATSHRHIWVYVVHNKNICLMYHILLRACFMKSEEKNVQRRTRLMTFENFKSLIDLRALNWFFPIFRKITKKIACQINTQKILTKKYSIFLLR
jgi:hypothetical protein